MENLFEQALRERLRFKLSVGMVSVEDLWDLRLEDLDKLYKSLKKQAKEADEESLLKTKTAANKTLDLQIEIVKHIVKVRLQEAEEKKARQEKAQKKAQILELIGRKEIQSLENKSIEELTKELEAL